jgi:DNA ligase-associated metallophosphoesterase
VNQAVINGTSEIRVNGVPLLADLSGALVWPERRVLAVADLHLEKGSAFARQGQLLPPYDTAATLAALAGAIERYRPERVICVGDSFHDGNAAERLADADGARLRQLTETCDWIWIAGNHDPRPPADWGGRVEAEVTIAPLVFRHQALEGTRAPGVTIAPLVFRHQALEGTRAPGEVSGHYHPKARVRLRTGRASARCFVTDGRRLVLPAFGAYTGGLNVLDPAIARLFAKEFRVHLLGRQAIHVFPRTGLLESG